MAVKLAILVAWLVLLGLAAFWWHQRQPVGIELGADEPLPLPKALDLAPQPGHSSVYLPLALSIAELQQAAERSLPRTRDGSVRNPFKLLRHDRLDWHLERGGIAFQGRAGNLYFSSEVRGKARLHGKVKLLVDVPVRAEADLLATVHGRIQPRIRSDWTLTANPTLKVELRRAEVPIKGLGRVSIRELIRAPLEQMVQGYLAQLELGLRRDLRLKQLARRSWEKLHRVIPVAEQPKAWLVMRPREVVARQPEIGADTIGFGLGVEADARLVVAPQAPENRPSHLPALHIGAARPSGLDFQILGSLPWDEASAILGRRLQARQLTMDNGAKLHVRQVALMPWGERVALVADIEASYRWMKRVSGQIRILARPVLDAGGQRLRFEDLELSAASRSGLLAGAAWLYQSSLLEELNRRSLIELGPVIDKARDQAQVFLQRLVQGLPREIGLEATLTDLSLDGITVTAPGLSLLARVKGALTAHVQLIQPMTRKVAAR